MNDGWPEHRKYKHQGITQTSIAPTTKQFSCHGKHDKRTPSNAVAKIYFKITET